MIICPLHVNNKCRRSCAFCRHNDYCLLQQALLKFLGYECDIKGTIEYNLVKMPAGEEEEK